MAFHDVQFPADIARGATGGPGFSTDVITVKSGREKRNVNWSESRGVWDVAHGIKNQEQLDRLIAFFRARRGKAHAFRFKDWSDYRIARQTIGSGDGVTTTFQIAKTYVDDGGYATVRPITKPVIASVQVWKAGALQASGYTVNGLTGVVTFSVAPGAGQAIEAACAFDVPARFDTDQMKVSVELYNLFTWGQIPVVEVRE